MVVGWEAVCTLAWRCEAVYTIAGRWEDVCTVAGRWEAVYTDAGRREADCVVSWRRTARSADKSFYINAEEVFLGGAKLLFGTRKTPT